MLMGIGGLVPLPSDALVTPVTFRVKKRQFRGILQQCDETETGLRELSGEWVVGKKTWQRLQSEWKANQQKARQRTEGAQSEGSSGNKPKTERVVLYIHGGKFNFAFLGLSLKHVLLPQVPTTCPVQHHSA
jgi:hypothetical protein